MSVSDPSSSLKKRSKRGNSEMDDYIIEDNDDFVIVNRRPSASLSKNLLSSVNSAEDDFIIGDEEVLAGGGDFGFEGDGVMGEGEELQGKGEESGLPQEKEGEESCSLQNGAEPRLNGEESEVPEMQDTLFLLPRAQEGVEPILLPVERVELQLPQERGVESNLLREPIISPEEGVHVEPHPLQQKGVEPYLIHEEGEETRLVPATEDSSAAEKRGGSGAIPQELADTFT